MAAKGQGGQLNVSTAAAAGTTITAITAASPVVVTATNTYANGDIIVLTGIVGPTNLNNRAFVASATSGAAFTLKGENGAANLAWVSGGQGSKQTMTPVGAINSITGFDGKAAEIDVTHLQSGAKEFLMGLQDFGNVTLGMLQISDAGQIQMRLSKKLQQVTAFSLSLADGTVAAFMAIVVQYAFDGVKPDGALGNSVVLRVTNEPAWFA